jgi:hypothetical protein
LSAVINCWSLFIDHSEGTASPPRCLMHSQRSATHDGSIVPRFAQDQRPIGVPPGWFAFARVYGVRLVRYHVVDTRHGGAREFNASPGG